MQTQNPIFEKYAGIRESGRMAYQSRLVKTFGGYSDALKKRFNISVLFDEVSQHNIVSEVIEPLSETISEISVIQAVKDFPLHTTILEAESSFEVEGNYEWFDRLGVHLNCILGKKIVFDGLIADAGGSVILVATRIPDYILSVRSFARERFEGQGLRPLSFDNILHSTQTRLTQVPPNQEVLYDFLDLVSEISHRLEQSPIVATIGEIHTGETYRFLTRT